MNTPSRGAMCALHELWSVPPSLDNDARIIDNHTNAIADELAAALDRLATIAHSAVSYVGAANYPAREAHAHKRIEEALASALARYQQIKAKETP